MANRIFRSTIFVAAFVLLCTVGVIMGVLYGYFDGIQSRRLRDELSLARVGTEQTGTAYLRNLSCDGFRLTWIDGEGQVLFDSRKATAGMENHADREEIRQAFSRGRGSSVRYSGTLFEKTRYEAVRLEDGSVLRISASQASSAALGWEMLLPIGLIVAAAVAMSALLARRSARHIVKPLNALDLEHPLDNQSYEELKPLLQRINRQHLQISAQMKTLKRRNDEFRQTTANMKEGLVLLDREDRVLQMNPAAARILGVQEDCTGRDFLALDAAREMRNAVNQVFLDGASQMRLSREGREYHVDMSRIASGGKVIGAVLLAFDVTEQEQAEKNRREFTANVSHELKTPLQSIMGSAELMENGLVKPEDSARFLSNIRRESERLLALIEDIIRLSQLEEGGNPLMETVSLRELSEECIRVLEQAAREKKVQLFCLGEDIRIRSVRRQVYEIIYNLCENAVKYNVEGGSVTVQLERQQNVPVLTVKDTGIGIPPEHQSRVFERFYRVDKSHSRRSGGTGLGLSIVKHGALQLGAELTLKSTPGEGTEISVHFLKSGSRIRASGE